MMKKFLPARIVELACQYGRYGYRLITDLLRREGRHKELLGSGGEYARLHNMQFHIPSRM